MSQRSAAVSTYVMTARLISISSSNQIAIRQPYGLSIVDLDREGPRNKLHVDDLVDFGFAGDDLWLVAHAEVWRYSPKHDKHAPASAFAGRNGQLVVTGRGRTATGLWTGSPTWLLHQERDGISAERRDDLSDNDYQTLLAGRCLVTSRGTEVDIRDLSGRSVMSLSMPGPVRLAADVLRGRGMVFVTDGGDQSVFVLANQHGRIVRTLKLPLVEHCAVAGGDGKLVASTASGALMAVDLRVGSMLGSMHSPLGIEALVSTRRGDTVVVAGHDDAGKLSVLPIELSTIIAGGASAPTRPATRDRRSEVAPAPVDPQYAPASLSITTTTEEQNFLPEPPAAAARAEPLPDEPPVSAPDAAHHAIAQLLLQQSVCHAAQLLERIGDIGRHTGVLSEANTGLEALVGAPANTHEIFADFRRIAATPPNERAALYPDTLVDSVAASRATLRRLLSSPGADTLGLTRMLRAFELPAVAVDQLLLALAPELDPRIGHLCGYLNNNQNHRRPKVGQLLMVGQPGLAAVDTQTTRMLQDMLVRSGLIVIADDPGLPWVDQMVQVPPPIVALATRVYEDDSVVGPAWTELHWSPEERAALRSALVRELKTRRRGRLVLVQGLPGSGRLAATRAAAREVDVGVELCELSATTRGRDGAENHAAREHIHRAAYSAKLNNRILTIRSSGALIADRGLIVEIHRLVELLDIQCCVLVRSGEVDGADGAISFVRINVPRLTSACRRELWAKTLAANNLVCEGLVLDDISARYDVTPGRVLELGAELAARAADSGERRVQVGNVRRALGAITAQRMSDLATPYSSSIRLSDLVLPSAVRERLDELAHRVCYRQRVLSGWSFADKAHSSFGVSALFVGPPGTGKTAAAAAVANALEVDLYIVNFSSVMSKWIGETEQNLARIFDEAEASSVALLFDEADALFGKRSSEQKSSSDRYANLTVNYLLQRMESYTGLAILTTNLESAMDAAFQRRLTTRIRFPETDRKLRRMLWQHLLPNGAQFGDDVDLDELSTFDKMQGAHIRRALTRAAFRAAALGNSEPTLVRKDLLWATVAEYEDMGRIAPIKAPAEPAPEQTPPAVQRH